MDGYPVFAVVTKNEEEKILLQVVSLVPGLTVLDVKEILQKLLAEL